MSETAENPAFAEAVAIAGLDSNVPGKDVSELQIELRKMGIQRGFGRLGKGMEGAEKKRCGEDIPHRREGSARTPSCC